MAINSRCFLPLLLFIGLPYFLAAQAPTSGAGFFIETQNGTPRFVQRLAWSGGNALRYEVVVEREDGGRYRSHAREFTTALFLNISLPPGRYRFRVIPYDYLNRPGAASQWMNIEVRPAVQPELFTAQAEFENREGGFIAVDVTGRNLSPEARIIIRSPAGEAVPPVDADFQNGQFARLYFDSSRLSPGEYEIVVINPGGLEASLGGIAVVFPETEPEPEPQAETEPEPETEPELEPEDEPELEMEKELVPLKPMPISVGAAYAPALPLYGAAFGASPSFIGAKANANILFLISSLYIGPEVTFSIYSPDMMAVGINVLLRKPFPNNITAVSLRLGADYVLPFGGSDININMGASFYIRPFKNFFIEAGIDYSHFTDYRFTAAALTSGCLRPFLGFGYEY